MVFKYWIIICKYAEVYLMFSISDALFLPSVFTALLPLLQIIYLVHRITVWPIYSMI